MELLAGGRDEVNAADLGDQLAQFDDAAPRPTPRLRRRRGHSSCRSTPRADDPEDDRLPHRRPRRQGGALPLLHADADFDRIAQVAPLRIEPLRP